MRFSEDPQIITQLKTVPELVSRRVGNEHSRSEVRRDRQNDEALESENDLSGQ
jgi:hypothetical protein